MPFEIWLLVIQPASKRIIVHGAERINVRYSTIRYAFAGNRKCKALGL
jgi:hypothetical protein